MHILIAPNAFKNSLSAEAAAAAILRGLEQSRLRFTAECFPVGDGGDGTGDLLMARLGAEKIAASVRDPFGRLRESYFGFVGSAHGGSPMAIIEMANASGLRLLDRDELAPIHASSIGTGDLIKVALEKGARHILIGMGGSATVDGGTGILRALGVGFLDATGRELTDLPADLVDLATIDLSGLDGRLKGVELTVLCDVDNPLLGSQGAATVFGPQKGASPADVESLEQALKRFAEVVWLQLGVRLADLARSGTAGGAAAGLRGVLGATLVDGIDYFLDSAGFGAALARADLVITGEGSLDEQTLKGKAPFGVAHAAKGRGLPVIAFAGRLPREQSVALENYFTVLLPINHDALPLGDALLVTGDNLTAAARAAGNLLAISGASTI